jgi:hypothetical protein
LLVFGEPYEASNGSVIVTVSRKGWGSRPEHPVGVYTVSAQGTAWTPAVDTSRLAMIGAATGFAAALISTIAVLRRSPWPEMTERVMTALAATRTTRGRR